jgi:hypothetical protein
MPLNQLASSRLAALIVAQPFDPRSRPHRESDSRRTSAQPANDGKDPHSFPRSPTTGVKLSRHVHKLAEEGRNSVRPSAATPTNG